MRYHDITKDDMKNGDGLRVVLWVSGCSHYCSECQNPITWNPDDGLVFDETAKKEIFEQLEKDYISGITLSGGDPLFMGNRDDIAALIDEISEKYPQKTIWIYTGYEWEQICDLPFIKKTDVCVDGKFIAAQKDTRLWWKGSTNQRVIDVKATLAQKEANSVILHCGDRE